MNEQAMLSILENNPQISVQDLADVLNVTSEEVAAKWKKMEEEHIICGYHTVINWDRTNNDHCSAMIEVSAKPERECGYDRVAERIARFDEVSDLYLMSGKSEFMVFLEGRTMREVSDFVATKLAPIEGVTSTVTCFMLRKYKVSGTMIEKEKTVDEREIVRP